MSADAKQAAFCDGCGESLRDTSQYPTADGRVLCIACSALEPEAFEIDPMTYQQALAERDEMR